FISSMAFFNSWADFTTSSMSMSNSANLMFSPAISQVILEVLTKSFQKDCHKLSVNKPLMLNSGHLPTLLLRHCLNAMVFPLPQRLQRAYSLRCQGLGKLPQQTIHHHGFHHLNSP